MFVIVDCVGDMTVKKSCKYGEDGSFKHLLFLLGRKTTSIEFGQNRTNQTILN